MSDQSIITQIENIQDEDELQSFIEILLQQSVSDEVMDAIEKRQDELYTPSDKDIAEKNLQECLNKLSKIKNKRSKKYVTLTKQLKSLHKIYDNA